MRLNLKHFSARVVYLSEVELLCDILGITSEDIIERFEDVVQMHLDEMVTLYEARHQLLLQRIDAYKNP